MTSTAAGVPGILDVGDGRRPGVRRTHRVTAVVVAHDGARWLPRLLSALADSTRPPDHVVAVDTGSRDETAQLLADSAVVDDVQGREFVILLMQNVQRGVYTFRNAQ